jgi:hypothetical protein
MNVIPSILANIRIVSPANYESSCWLWDAATDHGEPSLWVAGTRYRARQELFRQEFGYDNDAPFRGTHCDVPGCVNPLHDLRAPKPPRMVGVFEEVKTGQLVRARPKF